MKRRYGLCLRKALQPLLAPALTSGSAMVSKTYSPCEIPEVGEKISKCQKGICHPELVSGSHKEIPNRVRNDKKVKAAFTLAEVLITLGIIGVVAAMTIPTLISNIQEAHFHAKWKECYAILNNAFKMTVAENPRMIASKKNAYYPSSQFIDAILSHLHVVDTCGSNEDYDENKCDNYDVYADVPNWPVKYRWSGIANSSSRYTALSGGKLNAYDFGSKAALLKNGASIYFGGLWSGLTIVVDVNNFNGGPNILGKDVYAISLTASGNYYNTQYIESLYFRPYGAEGTRTEKDGYQGCDASIGVSANEDGAINALFEAPGAGCSYKYLNEK